MFILDNLSGLREKRRRQLSKEECFLLEAFWLEQVCNELTKKLMKETVMAIERGVINLLLQDLIRSDDYTISGVATYAHVPEEVIYDIAIGSVTNPTLEVSRKIIKLHMGSRPELYSKVMQKITDQYSSDQGG